MTSLTQVIVKILFVSLTCSLFVSCGSQRFYDQVKVGTFTNKPRIEWSDPELFNYRVKDNPKFAFKRHNGDVIIPGDFQTNGGSIPKFLWARKGYSPWTYLRSYLIHDWLYEAHARGIPSAINQKGQPITYSKKQADWIMAEAIKTEMIEFKDYHSIRRLKAFHWSVDRFGQSSWKAGPTMVTPNATEAIRNLPFLSRALRNFESELMPHHEPPMDGVLMEKP